MEKRKLLIFADWFEPGIKGGGIIRSCANVAQLLQEDFEVYVFTRNTDCNTNKVYADIKSDCWTIFDKKIHIYYCSKRNLTFFTVKKILLQIQPDTTYLNSMFSYYFTFLPLFFKKTKTIDSKIVLAPRGMLHKSALQYKYLKKRNYLSFLNTMNFFKNITFQATSEAEYDFIEKELGKQNIQKVPDLPSVKEKAIQIPIKKQRGILKCIFVSRISPEKNLIFLLELLAKVKFELKLDIVGSIDDLKYWKTCQELIQKLPQCIEVSYLGEVPYSEVKTLISQHHLFILTTLGENFGHTIYEALSVGRPVLISDQTPWQQLELQHAGWDLPLNNKKKFLEKIEDVKRMTQQEYNEWSKGASTTAKSFLESANFSGQYHALFK